MARSASASDRLRRHKQEILLLWSERVREEVEQAERELHPILIDTLPAFLDQVADALCEDLPRATATEGSSIAWEHGGERVRLTSFSLSDVIREYQLLRDLVFEVLERDAPLTVRERQALMSSIDAGLREACSAYTLVAEGFRQEIMLALAHDLRTPLSAAKAGVEVILRRPTSDKVPRWAARVDDNIDRVDEMIRTLLDVNRAAQGSRLALDLGHVDLVALATELVETLRLVHGDRIVLRTPASLPAVLSADAMRRALENLLSNALKYGDLHQPVSLTLSSAHGRALVSVHNEGAVIPFEEQPLLFEAFQRSRRAQQSMVRGWGLGLALVRAVAEAHGGSITVESLPDAGTTFTLDVPLDARPFQDAPLTPRL